MDMLQFKNVNKERLSYGFIYSLFAIKTVVELIIKGQIQNFSQGFLISLIPLALLFVAVSFLLIPNKKYSELNILKALAYLGLVYFMFFF